MLVGLYHVMFVSKGTRSFLGFQNSTGAEARMQREEDGTTPSGTLHFSILLGCQPCSYNSGTLPQDEPARASQEIYHHHFTKGPLSIPTCLANHECDFVPLHDDKQIEAREPRLSGHDGLRF